jgi:hypothetical protein
MGKEARVGGDWGRQAAGAGDAREAEQGPVWEFVGGQSSVQLLRGEVSDRPLPQAVESVRGRELTGCRESGKSWWGPRLKRAAFSRCHIAG